MAISQTRITEEELLAMPGDMRREIVDGELHELSPAGGKHGRIAVRIGRLLDQYAEAHGGSAFGAETGFKLVDEPLTIRAPDAAYVNPERTALAGDPSGFWPGAPDLAAEVVSPGDSYSETHTKALAWLAHGAQVVLVADPVERKVTRYRSAHDIATFGDDEPVDCAPALPGFAPTAGELVPLIR